MNYKKERAMNYKQKKVKARKVLKSLNEYYLSIYNEIDRVRLLNHEVLISLHKLIKTIENPKSYPVPTIESKEQFNDRWMYDSKRNKYIFERGNGKEPFVWGHAMDLQWTDLTQEQIEENKLRKGQKLEWWQLESHSKDEDGKEFFEVIGDKSTDRFHERLNKLTIEATKIKMYKYD